jgi:hypothetical protein
MTDPLIDQIRELRLDPMRCTSMARAFKNGSRPPSWPPATEQVVAEAESRLGFALPEFLRKLYLLVGNGGFGPGWGLAGLEGGYTLSEPWCADGSVVEASLRELAWNPDSKLLVVCDWGCLAASAIDCSTDSGEMVFIDEDDTRIREGISFRRWMQDWVDGVEVGDRPRKRTPHEEPEF